MTSQDYRAADIKAQRLAFLVLRNLGVNDILADGYVRVPSPVYASAVQLIPRADDPGMSARGKNVMIDHEDIMKI